MAYIYQITNDVNGKIYIGKTEFSIERRFKEHCKDRNRRNMENRPLYRAMNKYGIEHFHIELLEETDNPEEREMYWIKEKNSYGKNGYNATLGGDGKRYVDYDLVVEHYNKIQNMAEVARIMQIDRATVSTILKQKGIETLRGEIVSAKQTSKQIEQYDLENNYIQTFPSALEAARALGKVSTNSNGASSHITDVCRGKRKSAYGFRWKFSE